MNAPNPTEASITIHKSRSGFASTPRKGWSPFCKNCPSSTKLLIDALRMGNLRRLRQWKPWRARNKSRRLTSRHVRDVTAAMESPGELALSPTSRAIGRIFAERP
jgi:hypothetical protein